MRIGTLLLLHYYYLIGSSTMLNSPDKVWRLLITTLGGCLIQTTL